MQEFLRARRFFFRGPARPSRLHPSSSVSAFRAPFCYTVCMRRIAVVGGGPAGFMAAIAAAEQAPGASVDVLDAGVPLATVLRTGGGRCNLTNARFRARELAEQYPRGGKFLLSSLARFGPEETMEWFQARGLALVEEAGGRVFPRSGRAEDVRDLLAGQARKAGVRVRSRLRVEGIDAAAGLFTVRTPRGGEPFDRVIVSTGGDWRDGQWSGYRLARSLGHAVTPLAPSLTALVAEERWPGTLAGLTLRDAEARAVFEGAAAADERGDLLFTHAGITGPLAFRLSSRCAFLGISRRAPLRLTVAALPQMSHAAIEERLQDLLASRARQQVASAVRGLVPRSLGLVMLGLAGIAPTLPGAQLSREKRRSLERLLEGLPLTIIDRQKGEEMVTAGGVALEEVDPRTMESRIVPGLHFCGEVLDVDGFTGGFNLQAAWSTGRLAGLAAGA